VVGDLAGFVAATFMRGVPVIQLPTTLLAMVDASVGGKTAVDTPAGKNLVGAFHPPAAVLADLETLASLPRRQMTAGLAEVLKHGVIADAGYFRAVVEALPALLASGGAADGRLSDVVARSVAIKADVVSRDEREGGMRKILNFGHTIGHAVETLSDYTLLHGEAVAIGMVAESELAERVGLAAEGTAARVSDALAAAGLPVRIPAGMSADRIVAATHGDKKARAGSAEYALPRAIGAMAAADRGWSVRLTDDQVRGVLA
jgi:3-dehydroquinate synthase